MGNKTVRAAAGVGIPVKYAFCHAAAAEFDCALKRARRAAEARANAIRHRLNGPVINASPQKKSRTIGATPKLRKSARLSNSAPNCDDACNRLARRPSRPSSTAATTIANSANSNSFSIEKRTEAKPEQSASAVMALGICWTSRECVLRPSNSVFLLSFNAASADLRSFAIVDLPFSLPSPAIRSRLVPVLRRSQCRPRKYSDASSSA